MESTGQIISSDDFIAFSSVANVKTTFNGIIECVKLSNDAAAKEQLNMMFSTMVSMHNQLTTTIKTNADMAAASVQVSAASNTLAKTNSELTAHTITGHSNESLLLAQISELTQTIQTMNNDTQFLFEQFVRNFKILYGYESQDSCSRKECRGCCRTTGVKPSHVTLTCHEALKAYFIITKPSPTLQSNVAAKFKVTL